MNGIYKSVVLFINSEIGLMFIVLEYLIDWKLNVVESNNIL